MSKIFLVQISGTTLSLDNQVIMLAQGAAFDVSGDVALNSAHRTGDGSDHADVALNSAHRTGDGSDHADVALNSAHRTGDGSDHADVALNSAFIDPEGYNNSPLKAVLELADVISVETSTGGVFSKVKATLQILKDLIGLGGIDYANPISIVAATVLTSSAVGKHHVCSGVGADYLVELPTTGLTTGDRISFEMARTLVESVVLDATAGLAIDGLRTRKMHGGEVAVLKWDSGQWTKISGKSLPYIYSAERTTAVSVPTDTIVQVQMNSIIDISVPSMNVSGYCLIPRPGRYNISGMVSYEGTTATDNSGKESYCALAKNSISAFATEPSSLNVMPSSFSGLTTYGHPAASDARDLDKDDFIALIAIHFWGEANRTRVTDIVRPHLIVTEIPTW